MMAPSPGHARPADSSSRDGSSGNELGRIDIVRPMLHDWVRDRYGAAARLGAVVKLPGHSGITYSFTVEGAPPGEERLVVKVPPLGVAQRDNTDVLRQVPVLRTMAENGVRVPRLVAWGPADSGPFPVPFLIMEHVKGRVLGDVFEGPFEADDEQARVLHDEAIGELARIHGIAPSAEMAGSSRPRSLEEEVRHWAPILAKGRNEAWTLLGEEVRDRLIATLPTTVRTGVLHGDYYSNNWIFHDGRLAAVLDWENSVVGPQLVDVGWLAMMHDPESWGASRRAWLNRSVTPEWVVARYEAHTGRKIGDANWYRALAGYRLACLTGYYLRLHRTGRRVDAVWEVFGEAFPFLLGKAKALLGEAASGTREGGHVAKP